MVKLEFYYYRMTKFGAIYLSKEYSYNKEKDEFKAYVVGGCWSQGKTLQVAMNNLTEILDNMSDEELLKLA